jgi:hypothetical protein
MARFVLALSPHYFPTPPTDATLTPSDSNMSISRDSGYKTSLGPPSASTSYFWDIVEPKETTEVRIQPLVLAMQGLMSRLDRAANNLP